MSNATIESGRLNVNVSWADAVNALNAGAIESGEFADYVMSNPAALQGDPMALFALSEAAGGKLAQGDLSAIFRARETAIKAAALAAAPAKGRKTVCPVSAGEFVLHAGPLALTLPSGAEFVCDPRVFKLGDGADAVGKSNGSEPRGTSFGWQNNDTVTIVVNGKPCKVTLNVVASVANSGEASRGEGPELEALDAHAAPYLAKLAKARADIAERAAKKAAKEAAALAS
jgi:hypothetical protein